jgi:hypothetical protein
MGGQGRGLADYIDSALPKQAGSDFGWTEELLMNVSIGRSVWRVSAVLMSLVCCTAARLEAAETLPPAPVAQVEPIPPQSTVPSALPELRVAQLSPIRRGK